MAAAIVADPKRLVSAVSLLETSVVIEGAKGEACLRIIWVKTKKLLYTAKTLE